MLWDLGTHPVGLYYDSFKLPEDYHLIWLKVSSWKHSQNPAGRSLGPAMSHSRSPRLIQQGFSGELSLPQDPRPWRRPEVAKRPRYHDTYLMYTSWVASGIVIPRMRLVSLIVPFLMETSSLLEIRPSSSFELTWWEIWTASVPAGLFSTSGPEIPWFVKGQFSHFWYFEELLIFCSKLGSSNSLLAGIDSLVI